CTSARPSPGLIRSGLEIALRPSAALRRGRIRTMRRRRTRRFDFGRGPEPCYGLGWGELDAIHRATGVRNADFFVRARPDLLRLLRLPPLIAACRRLPPLREKFDAFAAAQERPPPGGQGRSRLIGFAYDPSGQRAATRLHLPDPYTVTAELAAAALARAVEGPHPPGLHTAGTFLGTDVPAALPGLHVDWEELELSAPGEVKLRIRRHRRRRPGFFFPHAVRRPERAGPPEDSAPAKATAVPLRSAGPPEEDGQEMPNGPNGPEEGAGPEDTPAPAEGIHAPAVPQGARRTG
ncbi:MAG: hypothetical protein ACLFV8_14190, partial [Alphaproteobacteria bacterium]